MNKSTKRLCIAGPASIALGTAMALGSATMLAGCQDDSSAEETVEDAADEAGDAVEDAGDAVGDAIDETTD